MRNRRDMFETGTVRKRIMHVNYKLHAVVFVSNALLSVMPITVSSDTGWTKDVPQAFSNIAIPPPPGPYAPHEVKKPAVMQWGALPERFNAPPRQDYPVYPGVDKQQSRSSNKIPNATIQHAAPQPLQQHLWGRTPQGVPQDYHESGITYRQVTPNPKRALPHQSRPYWDSRYPALPPWIGYQYRPFPPPRPGYGLQPHVPPSEYAGQWRQPPAGMKPPEPAYKGSNYGAGVN